jgi:hypothetical protein
VAASAAARALREALAVRALVSARAKCDCLGDCLLR